MTFLRHTAEKSTSFCGQDNSFPVHRCTPKYCGVLSSNIATTTYSREKTQRLDTCGPKTPSVIRGVRKKPPPFQGHGVEGSPLKTTKRTVVLPPPSQKAYSEL
ncbi:hypothetical protein TNCV_867231 [Trichonephila clavipes]|nr:hypothetical protein TNCV_867231 [Trichonephila clavipes]